MPEGIVWFKIHLCYTSQQMVVGFFEVGFYSNSTFRQLPPSSSFLINASFWKKRENEQRKVDFILWVVFFSFKGKAIEPSVSFFCGARCSSFASTSMSLPYYLD